ncbi:zinc transporter ZupT [Oceanispirochaeta crateris]|uniref:Zinc transporter ZupT n=1 Tax=Oceanispirochaeta crateris TaxID=2518645 RepID=A0A5C1QNS2_9SPIO|nr:zinc transporter ZupT [Oceanispirochaeta crateris]QEN08869.1 zinc transporter ZupT [Oceanispirochaeta crateris]
METENLIFALGLTVFAGLATGIGSLMSFFSKEFNPKFLAGSLGFSAGVMIYVSLIEIFVKARAALEAFYGIRQGYIITTLSFFAGVAVIAVIDKLIPSYENPHEISHLSLDIPEKASNDKKLMRMGLFSALAIGIHNFPEGLATFMAGLSDPTLGVSIAVAIAIHNIPEGIAVSAPIYYATKSKSKAFWLSFVSGLAEPVGALIGFFLLRNVFNDATFGIIFASVAGIMVYISLDELLPTAEEYGEHHIAIGGLIAGMAVMAISLLLFV